MKHRALLLAAAAAPLALASAWVLAGRMHRFSYPGGGRSADQPDRLAQRGWQLDRLAVDADVELIGLVRPPVPDGPAARWVLFVPGNAPDLLAGFQRVLDALFDDRSVGVAFWAYRGFDASTGTPSPQRLADDLLPQWRRLQQLGATAAHTEVWGYSLGSTLAPHLVAQLAARNEAPRRMVLLATAPRIEVMPPGWLGRFGPSHVYSAATVRDRVSCATVVGHGEADAALPLASAREVSRWFDAEFVSWPGRGHADLWHEARALRR